MNFDEEKNDQGGLFFYYIKIGYKLTQPLPEGNIIHFYKMLKMW